LEGIEISGIFINRTEKFYSEEKDPEARDDELTMSRLLREKNTFLSNLSYGEAVLSNLDKGGMIPERAKIIEIGPGTGELARDFCKELQSFERKFEYTFFDISKRLIEFLKSGFPEKNFRFVVGNAMDISGIQEKYNIVICNEVLADLPTIINMKTTLRSEMKPEDIQIYKDGLRMIKEYNLIKKNPEEFNFNYGAIKFLEEVGKILANEGIVLIIENSCGSSFPKKIPVFGHNEYNIKFDFLEKVSKSLGFSVERGKLTEFLGIKKGKKFISMLSQPELRILYESLKRQNEDKWLEIGTKVHTPEEFLCLLKDSKEVWIDNPEGFKRILEKTSKPLSEVTDQFEYMILGKEFKV
jgi:2-polyprenyl-3-methyl-5-hydroxy-6-metoxy-1,4-benzoquinol methylase